MKLALEEWIKMQERSYEICTSKKPEIPKVIFIGTRQKDGSIELRMKLISAAEWKEFQKAWERISGESHPDATERPSHRIPQFVLI